MDAEEIEKIRDWVENNIYPNQYDTRDEFETDIAQRIPAFDKPEFPQHARDNMWSDYQDLVSRVEDAEQQIEEISEEVGQEPISREEKASLGKRISRRIKAAIDRLLGVFRG